MADVMEVDTTADPASIPSDLPPLPRLHPSVTDPFELLCHALQPFIRMHLARALGPDMVSVFAPSPDATLPQLLRFIADKWLGVFNDTALAPHRQALQKLHSQLLAGADLKSEKNANKMAATAQLLITVVGRSSLAARVSDAIHAPSAENVPSAPPQPPSPTHMQHHYVTQGLHLVSGASGLADRPLPVVLDGANIAWKHGCNKRFSIRGAAEALHYYSTRGHPTVLFLPEARMDKCTLESERPVFEAVKGLVGSEHLVTTPDHDYDDSYICHFARRHGALVVSNDAFRDQVYQASADGKRQADEWVRWFKACRVSFTFRADLFIPNPSFNYEKAAIAINQLPLKD